MNYDFIFWQLACDYSRIFSPRVKVTAPTCFVVTINCSVTTPRYSSHKDWVFIFQDLDTRIIIASFSHEVAPKIFCEVSENTVPYNSFLECM
jgi:hypothetical protein